MRDGRAHARARNALLAEMTDEVAALVLRNNYLQTLALSLAERRGLEDLGFQQRLMQTLESAASSTARSSSCPTTWRSPSGQAGEALTRPELAVLLAYAKLSLYDELLDSTVPDDPYLGRELGRYFPSRRASASPMRSRHRLRREIIATQLTNSMINRGGPTLVVRIADQTGARADRIAAAFAAVRDSYGMIGAQRRDRCARRQGRRQAAARPLCGACRTCCSIASSGSCATSTCRRGSPSRRALSRRDRDDVAR